MNIYLVERKYGNVDGSETQKFLIAARSAKEAASIHPNYDNDTRYAYIYTFGNEWPYCEWTNDSGKYDWVKSPDDVKVKLVRKHDKKYNELKIIKKF